LKFQATAEKKLQQKLRGLLICPPVYADLSINQSIKTHFYSAICRERIRGAY